MVANPLSSRVLACYSGISMPLAAMLMPVAVYLPPFYASELGLSLATVGLIFTMARLWDVVTDPIMGLLIDRFDTRWGRRKHWVAISLPISMLSVHMVFVPDTANVSTTYLTGWLIVMYLGYTMMAIAHQSWGAELARSYDDRSRLFTWREVFVLVGMVSVLALPAVIELLGVDEQASKVASMGYLVVILLPLTALPLLLGVPDNAVRTDMTVDWREAISILLKNTLLWRILVADLAVGFAFAATGALYIFLVTYLFELPDLASIALLLIFLISAVVMPLWLKLAVALGKDRTMRLALFAGFAVHGVLYFTAEPGNAIGLWLYTAVYGMVFGAAPTLVRSMMADLTDYDELQTGSKRAGLFFALMTTSSKVGSALAVVTTFTFVEYFYGFQPGPDNTPQGIHGLLVTYCLFAALTFSIACVCFLGYPLTRERHREIEAELGIRMQS
ncbi:MAG: MFS transporter [Gammaproteobacteria bacterium]|nr:MFS transporter [Gammaproteobacteria bacterium]